MSTDRGRHFRMHRGRRQSGQAAVEAILVLPFLLLLVILAENSTVLMNRKFVAAVEARAETWRAGLAGRCGLGFGVGARCDTSDGRELLRDMERAGGNAVNGFTRVVRSADDPSTTELSASRRFEPFGDERLQPVELESTHAVSLNPVWEVDELPAGYDEELRNRLRGLDSVFPSVFPRRRR